MLEVVFWAGLATIAYTYAVYPLALIAVARLGPERKYHENGAARALPAATLVIAAYNEEAVIAKKIENSLALDYPQGLLTVIIASDGSSDSTNGIVSGYAGKFGNIRLLSLPRSGKGSAINAAMREVASDIAVFTDANTELEKNALKRLSRRFLDPDVGCVSGRLVYRNPSGNISGRGEGAYWRYEAMLKRFESRIGYVAGANGAIYAIRRELFEPLEKSAINDDFTISMKVVEKGRLSIYEEEALAYEDVAEDASGEFMRHVRDGAGHYIAMLHLLALLNPALGARSFIYWSHRVLRWAVPFIMVALIFLNMRLLDGALFETLFYIQAIFYSTALLGLAASRARSLPFFVYIPFYLCNLNLALLIGFIKAVLGAQKPAWEKAGRA
ncbi:MAG: glycosyltransferase family 2 protein [Deltaproteobacteria bacterium]|nr:glycosyltransferase family 2 protein [Deltaproteobacteria bacterium]